MVQTGRRKLELDGPGSPTTKECNSRVHKHIGGQKGRCYNRLTEDLFRASSSFPRNEPVAAGESRKETRRSGEDCHKEDHLVRIIE
jgi:hypothetical protein